MKKYWLVFKISIQRHLEYRLNLFINMGKYVTFNVLMAVVWIAVGRETGDQALNSSNMILYFTFVAFVYRFSNFHTNEVEEDIRLGYLSRFLLKPVSPFWYYFWYLAGAVSIEVVVSSIFLFPLFIIFWNYFSISVLSLMIAGTFIPLIFLFSFYFLFTISSLAFWFQEVSALRWAWLGLQRFISGVWVPLYLFPLAFQQISFYLPFQHLAYTPIQIVQSQIGLQTIVWSFSILLGWTLTFSLIQSFVWKKGLVVYEATGA